MENEAYIIKYIKQPSQLCKKHVYTKKHHIDNKMCRAYTPDTHARKDEVRLIL
jgi:hypothetical protein